MHNYGEYNMKKTNDKSVSSEKIDIPGLYRLKRKDREKLILTFLDAFDEYPKMLKIFPEKRKRLLALEATLRFYTSYDLTYGAGFSLDENIHEAIVLLYSEKMEPSFLKYLAAGSYGREYRRVLSKLSPEDRKLREALFDELEYLERNMEFPEKYIYADFLGMEKAYQHQGRGHRIMEQVCRFADKVGRPIVLFTNTEDDIKFYHSLGFETIGETSSETYGFVNTYVQYNNRTE